MQIKITDVRVSKVKTYQVAEVAYQDYRGEAKSWKLMSFSNPAVFAILKDAKAGESYEITIGKNDKDYTIWTQAVKLDGAAAAVPASNPTTKAAWVPDADRQRLIVKQSSITAALKYLELNKQPFGLQEITDIADELVKYVYDVPALEGADASSD